MEVGNEMNKEVAVILALFSKFLYLKKWSIYELREGPSYFSFHDSEVENKKFKINEK